MAIGMSSEEFWHGNPWLAKAFIERDKVLRDKAYVDEWRSGIYHLKAVAALLDKNSQYPERPLFSTEDEDEELRAQKALDEQRDKFLALMANANKRLSERESD